MGWCHIMTFFYRLVFWLGSLVTAPPEWPRFWLFDLNVSYSVLVFILSFFKHDKNKEPTLGKDIRCFSR